MLRKRFNLKREISIGDVLTSTSILISIVALLFSWSQSRALEEREQANKVRNAAAETIVKLERWQKISLSVFDEAQPAIIETSELLANNFSRNQVIKARDYLYKQLNSSHLNTKKVLREEKIETGYVYLYSYHPLVRERFQNILIAFNLEEDKMFAQLLSDTQNEVMAYLIPKEISQPYETAVLGNALRGVMSDVKKSYKARLEKILKPMEDSLTDFILRSDSQILSKDQLQGLGTEPSNKKGSIVPSKEKY